MARLAERPMKSAAEGRTVPVPSQAASAPA